jgi:tetratricopeptide (TPR) repeat protein
MQCHRLFFLAVFIAVTMQSHAESTGTATRGGCAIWGQVVAPGRSLEEPMDVELVMGNRQPSQKTRVFHRNFDFAAVPPGRYLLRVLDTFGREIYWRTEVLKGTDDHLIVQIPQLPAAASTLSLSELKHKTNSKAQDEIKNAEKALRNGKLQESADHLLKAVEIDPQDPNALTMLAATYAQMDRIDEALQQAKKAFETNPAFPSSGYQYALLLMLTKNYEMCETVARSVIRHQDYVAEVKALLAVSLIGQRRNLAEALSLVEQAATEFPLAHLLSANVLVDTSQAAEAVKQVRAYLNSSANPCERKQLEDWIVEVTGHSAGY